MICRDFGISIMFLSQEKFTLLMLASGKLTMINETLKVTPDSFVAEREREREIAFSISKLGGTTKSIHL
jgi:hypothetical protein